MLRKILLPAILIVAASLVSACSVIMPEQALTVNSSEPGAEVYLALHGRRSIGVSSADFAGNIPMGNDDTQFVYIGDTPLDHTFYTTRYASGVMVPGEMSSNQSTIYSEATVRVVYDDGRREERRVRLNNQHIELNFDGNGGAMDAK